MTVTATTVVLVLISWPPISLGSSVSAILAGLERVATVVSYAVTTKCYFNSEKHST